jgi:uncharacterized protein YukE
MTSTAKACVILGSVRRPSRCQFRRLRQTIAFGLVLSVAVAQLGCRRQRSRDCERFVTSVNDVLAAIDRHIGQVDGGELTNIDDMRKLAHLYETLSDRINHMGLRTPELDREARSYQGMVKTAAQAAHQVADALASEDVEKALTAQKQFSSVVAEEDKVVQRINGLCAER